MVMKSARFCSWLLEKINTHMDITDLTHTYQTHTSRPESNELESIQRNQEHEIASTGMRVNGGVGECFLDS